MIAAAQDAGLWYEVTESVVAQEVVKVVVTVVVTVVHRVHQAVQGPKGS